MRRATLNGVDSHYDVVGDGPAVLGIHGGYGGPGTSVAPNPGFIAAALEGVARYISYDRRGHGRSEYISVRYTNADLVADAVALLDHVGIERAIVVGSSAGGPIALQLALAFPERVSALGLMNTGSALMVLGGPGADPVRDAAVAARIAQVDRARSEGDRAYFESVKESLRTPVPPGSPALAARQEQVAAALQDMPGEDLFRYAIGQLRNYEAAIGVDLTARLGQLSLPVCVIHGTADALVPFATGEALAAGIARAEFHAIEGGTHGILAHPEAAVILPDWVRRVAA